jgi:MFS family permease
VIDFSQSLVENAAMPGLGRNFWRLWSASALSNVADGAVRTALPLVTVAVTRSPSLVAGVSVALGLPWLVFSLQAGALADRLDRRRTMLLVNLGRAVLLLTLTGLAAAGQLRLAVIYAVAFAMGIGQTMYDTSAQSILPSVVDRSALSRANSRLYGAEVVGDQFIGPPLGGVLVAAASWVAFGFSGAMWAAAGLVLLTVQGSYRPASRPEKVTLRSDIAEGLRFLRGHRLLRTLAAVTGVSNLGHAAAGSILVLYAVGPQSPMGLEEATFGLLLTSTAGGSLLGSVTAEAIERRLGRANTLTTAVVAMGAGAAGLALSPRLAAVAVWLFVTGLGSVVFSIVAVSLRQGLVPDRLLGRANAGYRLLAWGTWPIGAALGGATAELFGLRAVFLVAGAVVVVMAAARLIVTEEAIALAEEAAAEERAAGRT